MGQPFQKNILKYGYSKAKKWGMAESSENKQATTVPKRVLKLI